MRETEARRLPEAEERVMQALWACAAPAGRQEIEAHLSGSMAPTTVLTLLSRLTERGCVRAEKRGRQSLYTPTLTKGDYLASQSRRLFDRLCGGSVSEFAAALVDGGLTKDELRELRALLEEAET